MVARGVGFDFQLGRELGGGAWIAGGLAQLLDNFMEKFAGGCAGKGQCNDAFGLLCEVEQVDEAIGQLVGFTRAGGSGNRDVLK